MRGVQPPLDWIPPKKTAYDVVLLGKQFAKNAGSSSMSAIDAKRIVFQKRLLPFRGRGCGGIVQTFGNKQTLLRMGGDIKHPGFNYVMRWGNEKSPFMETSEPTSSPTFSPTEAPTDLPTIAPSDSSTPASSAESSASYPSSSEPPTTELPKFSALSNAGRQKAQRKRQREKDQRQQQKNP